jgi:5'-nucleotidase
VNRNLRLDKVELIGFDMDHTLAVYHKRRSEELAFEMTLARLVSDFGYPPDIGSIRYDAAYVIRGLVIDKEHGNIIKADRHNHVGRCYHGRRRLTSEERKALYRNEKIRLGNPRFAWIDTLFALPEACLYAFIVDLLEAKGERVDYLRLYDDIRAGIDSVHRDGSLKTEIKKDLARYIVRDPELGPALHKLRSGGKKLFLATNSFWDYTDHVMRFMLDGVLPEYPTWQKYFDYVVVGAQKPGFFAETNPFLELDPSGEVVREVENVERGRVYQGGNLLALERSSGIGGEKVLYVGDHIYGDILRSRKHSLWRTCMVVEELEDEILHRGRRADEVRRLRELEVRRERLADELNHLKLGLASLERRVEKPGPLSTGQRAELEEQRRLAKAGLEQLRRQNRETIAELESLEDAFEAAYNPYWGFVFKEGNENSRFGEQVEDYACLYTSRVSNLLYYSPMQYFRSPREIMPHERE